MAASEGDIVKVDRSTDLPDPIAPWAMVQEKFDSSIDKAEIMFTLLVGADRQSGFLGELNDTITSAPTNLITAPEISSSIVVQEIGNAPTFDSDTLDEYPDEEYSAPTMQDIPTIDTSELTDDDAPAEVNPVVSWSESSLSTDVYTDLLARLLEDLQTGSTGLSAEVEEALYERARSRQTGNNDTEYAKAIADLESLDCSIPGAALVNTIIELTTKRTAQDTDVNETIFIEQGKLAAENSVRNKELAIRLEELIRTSKNAKDQVTLTKATTDAELILRNYSEKIKAFVSKMEQKKFYIEAQAKNMEGVIASNIAKNEIYKAQYSALEVKINAISSKNKGQTDVYLADITAFSEKAKAIREKAQAQQSQITAEIAEADLELRAETENARIALEGYTAEGQLKISVAKELTEITAQSVAAAYGSVHASASLGYTGHESKTETWTHGDRLSEAHSFEDE